MILALGRVHPDFTSTRKMPSLDERFFLRRLRLSPFASDRLASCQDGNSPIGGCLALHLNDWESLGAEEWVLRVLREGYKIPLHSLPPLSRSPRQLVSYSTDSERGKALDLEITSLLDKFAVEEAPPNSGFYSRLFLVPKASGGFRPVIDLSLLNRHVTTTRFRMETVRTVLASIKQGDWMTSVDLKDAYLQVPIHPRSRRYLRFCWKDRPLQFRTLCFGLSTAPQVFTRIMAPISSALHKSGIRLLQYLDDWLLLAESQQKAQDSTQTLLQLCARLGVRINTEKSSLQPTQRMTFLGVDIVTSPLRAFPTRARVDNLLSLLQAFLGSPHPTVNEWMCLLGHMASLIHLVPGARLRMRSLQFRLHSLWSGTSQKDTVRISWTPDILQDLQWWTQESNLLAGQKLIEASPDFLLYTDASTEGWGCSLLHHTTGGLWSKRDSSCHINFLELKAVRLALLHFQHLLHGRTVGLFSDNTTALAYLAHQGGTHSSTLNLEAQRILRWAESKSISIRTQFIRGSHNVVADSLSRRHQVIPTEWTLHQEVCQDLWKLWGRPLIDLFATSQNYRIPTFVSPFKDPMAIATDAFLFNWDHQELYAFPPFAAIRQVLVKLQASQGTTLILIAPFWPRKEWFPDLVQMSLDVPRLLPFRKDLLRQPHFHRFHNGLQALQLTAWRLSSESSITGAIPVKLRDSWRALDGIRLL